MNKTYLSVTILILLTQAAYAGSLVEQRWVKRRELAVKNIASMGKSQGVPELELYCKYLLESAYSVPTRSPELMAMQKSGFYPLYFYDTKASSEALVLYMYKQKDQNTPSSLTVTKIKGKMSILQIADFPSVLLLTSPNCSFTFNSNKDLEVVATTAEK